MRFLAVALLLSACTTAEPPVPGAFEPKGDVLLTIDGKPIYEEQVTLLLADAPEEQKSQLLASGQLKPTIERLALADVFYDKAIADKLQDDPDVRLKLALAQRQVLAQAWVEKQLESAVSDEAIKKAYDERGVQFAAPEARVRLILIQDEKIAQDVWARVQKGEDFGALAKQYSLDTSTGGKGGEMGWVTKGQFTPVLDGAIFADDKVGPIAPISANGGFILVDVEERRASKPFDEVKDQLADVVRQEASEKLVTEAEKNAKIEWKKDPEPLLGATAPAPRAEGDEAPAPATTPAPEGEAAPAAPPAGN